MNIQIVKSIMNVLIILLAFGCSSSGGNNALAGDMEYGLVQSDLERDLAPAIELSVVDKLVEGNSKFAFDLYEHLKKEPGNVFFSPFSISQALSMTYAGARGNSEAEMESTLHLLGQDMTHKAFNKLDLRLHNEGIVPAENDEDSFKLNIANSIWAQKGFNWRQEFLDTMKKEYGAGIHSVDFASDFEDVRLKINDWVEQRTNDKIKNLLAQGTLDSLTRMVLVNTIYFLGKWSSEFEKNSTYDQAFYRIDGSTSNVPMMHQDSSFRYYENDGLKALQMDYRASNTAMLVILPDRDKFSEIESSMDFETLNTITANLENKFVQLAMPKVKMEAQFGLADTLSAMGMLEPFSMDADFSGMNGKKDLFISKVIHKAYVDIDEEGTEAAAATAVVMTLKGMPAQPEIKFIADHPFIFLIRDKVTGSILFFGRVMDPTS